MEQSDLSFQFTARYYKFGDITSTTKQLWFVLHGHGQLAKFFIQKFKTLEQHGICVIAPEGLSRYYTEGISGRVGSTWMTKENRLMDIANYVEYLNELYKKEVLIHKFSISTTVLGFSQGAATASRWGIDGKISFERLILWGGVFPPDMDFDRGENLLKNKETYLVYGTHDPFINDQRFTEMKNISEKLNVNPHLISFNGDHEIDEATLLKFI